MSSSKSVSKRSTVSTKGSKTLLRVKHKGADPFVWGQTVWCLLEDASYIVQQLCKDNMISTHTLEQKAKDAYAVAVSFTQVLLCNPCRLFYIQRFETEPLDMPPSLMSKKETSKIYRHRVFKWSRHYIEWIRSLHASVHYKIVSTKNSPLSDPPLAPTHDQLERRMNYYHGSFVSNDAILRILYAMTRYVRFKEETLYKASFVLLVSSLASLFQMDERMERSVLGSMLHKACKRFKGEDNIHWIPVYTAHQCWPSRSTSEWVKHWESQYSYIFS